MTTLLPPEDAERMRSQDLTYAEVGCTRGTLPSGYAHLSRRAVIGTGPDQFAASVAGLWSWQLQRGAGVRVLPSSATVVEGAVAVLLLGVGPLAVRAPVRVVYRIDEPHRRGFGYGTLPGHPESGEEAFVVELATDDTVTCQIIAFSRPVSRLARWGGPVAALTQRWVIGRYLRSLAQQATPPGTASSRTP